MCLFPPFVFGLSVVPPLSICTPSVLILLCISLMHEGEEISLLFGWGGHIASDSVEFTIGLDWGRLFLLLWPLLLLFAGPVITSDIIELITLN